jgi:hypothetical protein
MQGEMGMWQDEKFIRNFVEKLERTVLCEFLLPQYGASSCRGWRRRPLDVEGNCEYI